MNVTFLIGNGFDLGIGLKTTYLDFYNVYCKTTMEDSWGIKRFKSELQDNYENWSDFEAAFGEYASNLYNSGQYLEMFEDFVIKFSDYLKNEEKNFDSSKIEFIQKSMKKALVSYYDIRPEDKEQLLRLIGSNKVYFDFVSFNYTRCLDTCLRILCKQVNYDDQIKGYISNVVHVHGYTEDNMIMGVNDISQIKNSGFSENLDVTEEIVKPLQNQVIRMNFDNRATRIIKGSSIICVYGMSIGVTDKKWWKLIMDWLQENSARHLIVLQHKEGTRFTFRWNRLVKEVRAKLFLYGNIPEEKQSDLVSRIHIEFNHDIFAMNLRKQDTDENVQPVKA